FTQLVRTLHWAGGDRPTHRGDFQPRPQRSRIRRICPFKELVKIGDAVPVKILQAGLVQVAKVELFPRVTQAVAITIEIDIYHGAGDYTGRIADDQVVRTRVRSGEIWNH